MATTYLHQGGDNSSQCTNVAAHVDSIDDEGTELARAELVLNHQAGSKPQHTNDASWTVCQEGSETNAFDGHEADAVAILSYRESTEPVDVCCRLIPATAR